MDASPAIDVVPVAARNWRDCAALRTATGQEDLVSPVAYSLCLWAYGPYGKPWATTRDDRVAEWPEARTNNSNTRARYDEPGTEDVYAWAAHPIADSQTRLGDAGWSRSLRRRSRPAGDRRPVSLGPR